MPWIWIGSSSEMSIVRRNDHVASSCSMYFTFPDNCPLLKFVGKSWITLLAFPSFSPFSVPAQSLSGVHAAQYWMLVELDGG